MKKCRCNLDEEPIKEVTPTVRITPQKFSWIGNHRKREEQQQNNKTSYLHKGNLFSQRIILNSKQRSTNQLCSHARVPEDANEKLSIV